MGGPLLYDFGGLVTAPGLLARNPASCVAVSNFRFPIAGVMRKRTGYSLGAHAMPAASTFTALLSSKTLGNRLFAYMPTFGLAVGGPANAWTGMTFASSVMSNFKVVPGAARMGVLGPGHYLTGGLGVVRVESDLTLLWASGMPRGLAPITYSMDAAVYSVLTGAPGLVVADGSNVAYRVTWHRKDASGNYELGGAPSSRLVVRNIAGTSGYGAGVVKNVVLRLPLPFKVDDTAKVTVAGGWFWRLWRSRTSAIDTADDEMYLVAEAFVTAADAAAGYAVYTDQTPDPFLPTSLRLHTNGVNFPPLEAGLLNGQTNADEPPPAALDVATFAGCLWFAGPTWRPFQALQLLALPAANDTLAVLESISSTTVTLKCVAGAPAAAGEFTLVNGLATLSLNLEATARNMVDAYTRAATKGTKALYLSQGTQSPGQMAFEGMLPQGTLTLTPLNAGVGALFCPVIPAGGTVVAVTTRTNALCFSKPGRPDAVPPVNVLDVGPSASSILRIIAFRERLLCFTTEGLYEVSGTYYGNFTVSLVDAGLRLLAPETVCVMEDRCFAWCKEGIAEISSAGALIISDSIAPTVLGILRTANDANGTPTGVIAGAFAVADRRHHRVMFFYTDGPTTYPYCADWLEWDARARKWSQHHFAQSAESDFARPSIGASSIGNIPGLTGRTLILNVSGDGGVSSTAYTHTFAAGLVTLANVLADILADAPFVAGFATIAIAGSSIVFTGALGAQHVITVDPASTSWFALGGDLTFSSMSSAGVSPERKGCGVVLYSNDLPVLASTELNPESPALFAKIYLAREALAAADYQDTTYGGTNLPVSSSATFQFQVPDLDARQHWQQLLAQFENGEQSFYPRPTGITVAWETDAGGLLSGVSIAPTSPLVRVETPTLARRATRQRVTIAHTLAEHFGLLALKQSLAESKPARFPR